MSTNVENLTPELINELLSLKPEIRGEITAAIDAKIAHLNQMRGAVAGEEQKPAKKAKKSATVDTSKNIMKHKEAVLKVLNLADYKNGATSRDIRKTAEDRYGHVFGSSLGTTLNSMIKEKDLKGKPKAKDAKHLLYFV